MAESVDECRAQYLVFEHLFPSGKRQVGRYNGGFLSGSERQMIEEHLCTFLVEADVSEFVAYDEVISFKLDFQISQCLFRLCLPDHCQQVWDRGEKYSLGLSLDVLINIIRYSKPKSR